MKKSVCYLSLALALTACSTPMQKTVQERASYDLKCDEMYIEVVGITGNSYAAKGCGKESIYNCFTDRSTFGAPNVCVRER